MHRLPDYCCLVSTFCTSLCQISERKYHVLLRILYSYHPLVSRIEFFPFKFQKLVLSCQISDRVPNLDFGIFKIRDLLFVKGGHSEENGCWELEVSYSECLRFFH
jgi:hypothetical protein